MGLTTEERGEVSRLDSRVARLEKAWEVPLMGIVIMLLMIWFFVGVTEDVAKLKADIAELQDE